MFKSEFDQIVRENFDLSDTNTRRYIATLEDAGQEQLLAALSSALYEQIVAKVDDIDFGTIPLSRGDITKVQGFDRTEECINIIRRLVLEYKQDPAPVDVIISAISNIKGRKAVFIKAYALDIELPMLVYNLITLSIERSVSLMIATCIQYVSDPSSKTTKQALDKVAYQKTMDDVLFQQLVSFNNICKNKTLDKIIDESLKHPVVNKEDVEFQYDVEAPIDEDDDLPTADTSVDNTQDTINSDIFAPDDSTNPYPQEADPSAEPVPEDDTVPTQGDFPEELHDDEGNPIPSQDDVEPENIPMVVPGDDVNDSNAAINEDEIEESLSAGKVLGTVGGVLSKSRDVVDKAPKAVKTAAKIASAALVIGAAIKAIPFLFTKIIIPMVRNIVYTFYYTRMKLSDYLAIQADFLEANAIEVENSTEMDDNKKKKVAEKQRKVAEKLRKWSNIFSLDKKSTENKTKQQTKEDESKKRKVQKDEDGDDVLF